MPGIWDSMTERMHASCRIICGRRRIGEHHTRGPNRARHDSRFNNSTLDYSILVRLDCKYVRRGFWIWQGVSRNGLFARPQVLRVFFGGGISDDSASRDELDQGAVAPHEKVARHAQPGQLRERGMRRRVEPVGEQPLDGVAAVHALRQADGMQQQQGDDTARRPAVAIRRQYPPRVGDPPFSGRPPPQTAGLIGRTAMRPASSAVLFRLMDAEPLHAVAQRAKAHAEQLGRRGAVEARLAERKAARLAEQARQAATLAAAQAAEAAAREAAAKAEKEASDAEFVERTLREAADEAEKQAASDARYAARKARKKKGR
jgi:flagellar biosynthesis GTPase FlhF